MSDTYKYKRYMRNGQAVEKTAVVRQKRVGTQMKKLNAVRDARIEEVQKGMSRMTKGIHDSILAEA